MSAPVESIIAEAIAEHPDWGYEVTPVRITCHGCDWEQVAGDDIDGQPTFVAHQAAVVLAALQEAGTVEWGVRWPYLSDMYPERTDTKDSQEAAQAAIDKSFADGAVVSRIAGPWQEVERG